QRGRPRFRPARRRSAAAGSRWAARPAAGALEAVPGEQIDGLEERQSHDIRIGADDGADEARGDALDGIAAGLALPFPGIEIEGDLGRLQALEDDGGLDAAADHAAIGQRQRDGAMDAVPAPREKLEAGARLVAVAGLRQDAPPAGDDGVSAED